MQTVTTQTEIKAKAKGWSETLRSFGEVLVQSAQDFVTDNGSRWAGAIAHYGFLSAFPLLLVATAVAAYLASPEWAVQQVTSFVDAFLPKGTFQVNQIVQGAIQARRSVAIAGGLSLLWSGSRLVGIVTAALNIAYDTDEPYRFLRRTIIEIFTFLTIGVAFFLAFAARPGLNAAARFPGVASPGIAYRIATGALTILLFLGSFFLLYRFVPRRRVTWRAALVGAGVATALFVVARPIFQYYVGHFGNYNLLYGSLAIGAILIFWAWIIGAILLFGGEIASHTQDMMLRGKPASQVAAGHRLRSPARKH